ncbi:MAG: hypothetical protein CI953_1041 [Methanohalophilus sp.]|nr:MAG: hypothetical protein CI953_1041 [Methanohalophilus sp.]
MCIIIDINTFGAVFNPESSNHDEFKPVFNWIYKRNGKVVYGGTKYKKELKNAGERYLEIFLNLKRVHRAVEVDQEKVDKRQDEIESKVSVKKFNDAHISAIVAASKCKLICSLDSTAHPFFTDKRLYPKDISVPKIYSRRSHEHLLCDRHIAKICE